MTGVQPLRTCAKSYAPVNAIEITLKLSDRCSGAAISEGAAANFEISGDLLPENRAPAHQGSNSR